MSPTRLLVLGAIRVLQPVHGYDVRRELVSWRMEDMTNMKPGSIYGAIRTLERDGCLAVHSRASADSRPERTSYVLTGEGEKEFQLLLRSSWWTVKHAASPLLPALALMPFLPREELIRALHARIGVLEGDLDAITFTRASILDGATGAEGAIPEHVRESFDYISGLLRAQIDWSRTFQRRLRDGAYRFEGEADPVS